MDSSVAVPWRGGAAARGAARRSLATAWAMAPLVVVGFLLRLAVADRFPQHVDEGNMLLGIQTVANRGWPLLPSDVLYIHGATISYLLAPLAKLGLLDYLHPLPMRIPSAIFGAVAVYLTYLLGRAIAGMPGPALFAALLVAVDPLNVLWGGFARMYALLQVLILVATIVFLRALVVLDDAPSEGERRARPWLIAFVVAFWLAIFTQVVAALLWPVFALVAIVLYGRTLFTSRRGLSVALVVSALAPVAFLALSTFVGYGSSTSRAQKGSALGGDTGFLGDDALNFERILRPIPRGFLALYDNGLLSQLIPYVIAIVSGVALGRFVLSRRQAGEAVDGRAIGILLVLFWTPMAAFAFFVDEQKPRYLLDVLPFGYVVVAAAAAALGSFRPAAATTIGTRWGGRVVAVALAVLLLARDATGLWTLDAWGTQQTQAGYGLALDYVATHRAPGDWAVVGSTPEAYLVLGDNGRELAYGGVLARPGSGKQTSATKIDDWVGWSVLDTVPAICAYARDHPGSWFVLSNNRLAAGKPTTDATVGVTAEQFHTADGYRALRVLPASQWNEQATRLCKSGR